MKKYVAYIFSICLILAAGAAFAQGDGETPYVKGITTGRAKAIIGGLVGLLSLIAGWRARVRSTAGRRTGAITALVLGLISIILSVVHLATTAGAVFGSGSGKAGAIVALALGLAGLVLGGLTLRSLKTG